MENKDFIKAVNKRLKNFEPALDTLNGVDKVLAQDLAREYCQVCVQADEIQERINTTGYTVLSPQGASVKNPDVATKHQLIQEKVSIAPKLVKLFKDGGVGDDELARFLR